MTQQHTSWLRTDRVQRCTRYLFPNFSIPANSRTAVNMVKHHSQFPSSSQHCCAGKIIHNTAKFLISVREAINFRRALDAAAIGGRRLLEARRYLLSLSEYQYIPVPVLTKNKDLQVNTGKLVSPHGKHMGLGKVFTMCIQYIHYSYQYMMLLTRRLLEARRLSNSVPPITPGSFRGRLLY